MKQKTTLLLQLIAKKSALPEGFFTADAKEMGAEKNAAKLCRQQVEDGTLYRVRAGQSTYAYFRTQAMANAYLHQHRGAVLAKAATRISFESKAPKLTRCSAEIVHTAQTRYINRPWVDARAVSVQFQRIGQPGFSMSI